MFYHEGRRVHEHHVTIDDKFMAAIELNRFEFLWRHRAFHHESAPAFDLGLDKAIAGKEPLNAVMAVRFTAIEPSHA